jgi:hypothetical protein
MRVCEKSEENFFLGDAEALLKESTWLAHYMMLISQVGAPSRRGEYNRKRFCLGPFQGFSTTPRLIASCIPQKPESDGYSTNKKGRGEPRLKIMMNRT